MVDVEMSKKCISIKNDHLKTLYQVIMCQTGCDIELDISYKEIKSNLYTLNVR